MLEGSQQATGSSGSADQQAFLLEWDDLSEEALQDTDKGLRQGRNAYDQMKTEMASSISRTGIRPFPSSLRDSIVAAGTPADCARCHCQ